MPTTPHALRRRRIKTAIALAALIIPFGAVTQPDRASAVAPAPAVETGAKAPWVSVGGGGWYTCGVREDGSLWCWGAHGRLGDDSGRWRIAPKQVGSAYDWTAAVPGESHTCATKTDGTLWCFGANADGQLGDGTTKYRYEPVQVAPEVDSWVQVGAGQTHTCATRTDLTLWCWGKNDDGQIGVGETGDDVREPVQVDGPAGWTQVSADGDDQPGRADNNHTCAIKDDATLWCWGSNDHGELGTGVVGGEVVSPVQIAPQRDWASVSVGERSTCAVAAAGSLWCWGSNQHRALGLAGSGLYAAPTQVGTSSAWAAVSNTWHHTCATQVDGSAWCWGSNNEGQLGDGTQQLRPKPVTVAGDHGWEVIDTGWEHTCGVTTEGAARCWGADYAGELGTGRAEQSSLPRRVIDQDGPWTTTWQSTDAGCGVTTRQRLSCWGSKHEVSTVPYAGLLSRDGWDQVSSDRSHVCAIGLDTALLCAGSNQYDALGNPAHDGGRELREVAGGGSWARVSAGYNHTCGIQTDGSLWCWGYNLYGALGLGDALSRDEPTRVGAGTWTDVSAGAHYTCAIASDGSLWCWGDNADGELGDGTTERRTTPTLVDAGQWTDVVAESESSGSFDLHTCAIRADGSAWCWGAGPSGELGDGSPGDSLVPVQVTGGGEYTSVVVGRHYSCGLQADQTAWCWGGELGGTEESSFPLLVEGDQAWLSLSGLHEGVCGVTDDQVALCWGDYEGDSAPSLTPEELRTVRHL